MYYSFHYRDQLDDTLFIVTADHSDTLSINGYPDKGSSVLSLAQRTTTDKMAYSTLTYAVGGRNAVRYDVDEDKKPVLPMTGYSNMIIHNKLAY